MLMRIMLMRKQIKRKKNDYELMNRHRLHSDNSLRFLFNIALIVFVFKIRTRAKLKPLQNMKSNRMHILEKFNSKLYTAIRTMQHRYGRKENLIKASEVHLSPTSHFRFIGCFFAFSC